MVVLQMERQHLSVELLVQIRVVPPDLGLVRTPVGEVPLEVAVADLTPLTLRRPVASAEAKREQVVTGLPVGSQMVAMVMPEPTVQAVAASAVAVAVARTVVPEETVVRVAHKAVEAVVVARGPL